MEQTEPERRTKVAVPRRHACRIAVPVVVLATTLAVTACSSNFGLPDSATEQGDAVVGHWRVFIILAAVIAGLIWVLTTMVIVASLLRRRRHGREVIPVQHQYRTGIEIAYTAAPLVIVAGLLALTLVATNRLTDQAPRPDLAVRVTGFQWQWQAEYPDRGLTVAGNPDVLPELWLPVGRIVRFTVTSPDVIHSFWVPEFLEKRDLIPGVENTFEVTVKAPGQWIGRCAEYCGLYHWQMKFAVCAVDGDRFDAWLAENAAKPQPVVAGPATPRTDAATGNPTPTGPGACPSAPASRVGITEDTAPSAAGQSGPG